MWFQRPFRADQWLLYAQDTPERLGCEWAGLRRGVHPGGELVVSVVQEGLVRTSGGSDQPRRRSDEFADELGPRFFVSPRPAACDAA
jgi:hypothetical protein